MVKGKTVVVPYRIYHLQADGKYHFIGQNSIRLTEEDHYLTMSYPQRLRLDKRLREEYGGRNIPVFVTHHTAICLDSKDRFHSNLRTVDPMATPTPIFR